MSPHSSHLSPFKGLMPYTAEDAQFFFGREEIRDIIIDNLQAWRLTLLYGASGAGKSSVLHAGVVPTLRERGRQSMEDNQRTTPEFSVITFNSWSDDPVAGLKQAIQEHLRTLLKGTTQPLTEPPTLSAALDQWVAATDTELYIILDQFEEYFQYDGRRGPGTFAAEFPRAVLKRIQRIKFLISIREEAYAKLDLFRGIPNLFTHSLRVRPLNVEEAREAIEGPIRQYNKVAGAVPVAIEPQLLESVLESVKQAESADGPGTDPGSEKIDLTILQQVMIKLWDEEVTQNGSNLLSLSTFERLGGAQNIVRTHFSSAMERLTPAEQKTAASIFRYLVTPSGTKIAQTAADLADLADYGHSSKESVREVLDRLTGSDIRILRAISATNDKAGEVRYEIFHDVLSGPINEWSRAYEANERAERARLEARRDRDLVRARYSRYIVRGLAVILLIVSVILIWAFSKKRQLSKQTEALTAARTTDTLYRDAFRQSRRRERKEEAIENFKKALAVYLKSNDPSDRWAATETYINIGEIHLDLGSEQEASRFFQDAINSTDNSTDKSAKAMVLTSIGDAYNEVDPRATGTGVPPKKMAAEKYTEALSLYQDNPDPKKQAAVLISLALVNLELSYSFKTTDVIESEREKAYRLIEQARDLYKQVGDHKGQGLALSALADAQEPYSYGYGMTPEMRQAMSKIEQSVTEKREEAVKEYDLAEHAERRNISVREKLVEHYEVLAQKEKILEHLSAIARLYEKLDDEAGRNATQVQIDRVSASNQASPERPKSPYGPYEQAQRRAPAPPQ